MNKLIAVTGTIGSGKDMVGEYLTNHYGFTRMSFAAALKDSVAAIFRWDRELLDGTTPESRAWRETPDPWWTEKLDFGIPVTPRWVLVNYATDVMRHHFHQEIWILSLARQVADHDGPVVLTDGRFLNELAWAKSAGGLVVGIHRRTPNWLAPFYGAMDRLEIDGLPVQELDLYSDNMRTKLVGYGHKVMTTRIRVDDRVHESEWQHVLWNDYDAVIDNRKTMAHTFDQVENIVKGQTSVGHR